MWFGFYIICLYFYIVSKQNISNYAWHNSYVLLSILIVYKQYLQMCFVIFKE
jgi:hypothetical protein